MADELSLLTFKQFVNRARKKRTFMKRSDPFTTYDEEEFRRRFRLSKATVMKLLEQVNADKTNALQC